MIKVTYPIKDLREFLRLKPIKPNKSLMDEKREALGALNRLYDSNKNNKYGERLMKATDKVKQIEQRILNER